MTSCKKNELSILQLYAGAYGVAVIPESAGGGHETRDECQEHSGVYVQMWENPQFTNG